MTPYERALAAEPELRTAVDLVDALTSLVRPSDRLCSGCVWETLLKPIVSPLIGWERGHLPKQAKDLEDRHTWQAVDWNEVFDEHASRPVAETDTERWLRTSEAYDGFTDPLLDRLDRADPANGHGIGRASPKAKP